MKTKSVKDVMLPLSGYAVVSLDATLRDALKELDRAQMNLPAGKQPHRAVLVADENGEIVGKLGHLGFLKALEPKYDVFGDMDRLSRAGVSEEFVNSMMDNFRFWTDDFSRLSQRARIVMIKEVMTPVDENISQDASLAEAIHRMIMWQTLSILVTRGDEVVGILRLSDLFTEVASYVVSSNSSDLP